jgi:hypothetical protein
VHEPWIERVIREAQAEGKFNDVPGTGRPIPDIDQPYDPAWWARRWVRRERQREQTRELAHEIEARLPRILAGANAAKARADLESLNTKIREHNAASSEGDEVPLLDVEQLLEERAQRHRG